MHLRLIRGDIFERVGNNFVCEQIAHFRAALSLSIKATPGALPFI